MNATATNFPDAVSNRPGNFRLFAFRMDRVEMNLTNQTTLLQAAQAGDQDAVDSLLSPHKAEIWDYLRKRARSFEDAEDLLSNTLFRVLRYLPSFHGECPISALMIRAAKSELANYYAREIPRQNAQTAIDTADDDWMLSQVSSSSERPDGVMLRKTLMERLMNAIQAACSEAERVVLVMTYQGDSFEEIARTLRMKSTVVRTHFLRGRGKLMAHLFVNDPDFIGGSEGIAWAYRKANEAEDPDHRLKPEEVKAMENPHPRNQVFRLACLKVARFLVVPTDLTVVVCLLMKWRGWI